MTDSTGKSREIRQRQSPTTLTSAAHYPPRYHFKRPRCRDQQSCNGRTVSPLFFLKQGRTCFGTKRGQKGHKKGRRIKTQGGERIKKPEKNQGGQKDRDEERKTRGTNKTEKNENTGNW
ncbi:hypothetical protein POPTR_005G157201v4 [Populus trichocarpa]|uniref:Uncharacterized protein n=1 Tax=Populus trichocarpa TaxID=3694 RepID=A0ACC0T054_POPTR|nr:hypothetical protein POPTR_005G157201v4 [Populus trichocarpa]